MFRSRDNEAPIERYVGTRLDNRAIVAGEHAREPRRFAQSILRIVLVLEPSRAANYSARDPIPPSRSIDRKARRNRKSNSMSTRHLKFESGNLFLASSVVRILISCHATRRLNDATAKQVDFTLPGSTVQRHCSYSWYAWRDRKNWFQFETRRPDKRGAIALTLELPSRQIGRTKFRVTAPYTEQLIREVCRTVRYAVSSMKLRQSVKELINVRILMDNADT